MKNWKLARALAAAGIAIALPLAAQPFGPPPPVSQDGPVTPAEARETAAEFARLLEENYLNPRTAERYSAAIRAASARGDYDQAGTASALAQMLTRDVQAVAPDAHLRVMVVGGEGVPPPLRMMMRRAGGEDSVQPMEPGPGRPIEVARWIAPGIAFVRFTSFESEPATVAAALKFMRDHADATTVIFDLRTHRGGGGAEMEAMFPYLFAEETALMRFEIRESVAHRRQGTPAGTRRSVAGPADVVTEEQYVRPHRSEKRLFDARIFVLTSPRTASAAEHFALALKSPGRATLIGEVTAGAGNFAYNGPRPVGKRFTAFIPVGRTYDPRGGRGWEGTGIAPDIAVPAERALVEALVRSGLDPAEAKRLSASVHPAEPMERMRPGMRIPRGPRPPENPPTS